MAALTGRNVRDSYIELLKLNTASTNTGVTGSLIDVTDGGNTASALSISTSQIASTVDGSAGTAAFTRKTDTNTGVFFPAADTIAATTQGTERLRIDSSGNVGIGNTSPGARLEAASTNAAASVTVARFSNLSGSGFGSGFDFWSGQTGGYSNANITGIPRGDSSGNLILSTADTSKVMQERARILGNGNVGIGLTSPTEKLHVSGNAIITGDISQTNGATTLARNSASVALSVTQSGAGPAATFTGGFVGIGMTPTAQLELSTDDAKKPSTNTWTVASDQRLKTNITNADNDRCYEIVKQVPLKRYTWKSEVYSQDKVKDRSKLGWIAQDVEEVFPKAVGTNRFAYNQVFEDVVTPELDSDGNAVLDENGVAKTKTEKRLVSEDVIEDCKDLNSDQIYAAMYGAIKKLIEKVETLEAKVLALEAA